MCLEEENWECEIVCVSFNYFLKSNNNVAYIYKKLFIIDAAYWTSFILRDHT